MNHSTNTISKNLDLSGTVREQINFNTYIDHHHDLGYVSPAAIETVQTHLLQPGQESIQGGHL